ncbi:uncharacterized protein LOC106007628 [Heterocephalus glaber]|uniref:Uncharacterized protein LOC106007628 n=1 Tax=Heterocephalus glaber TaxID=10181 RepID=A0AAX6R9F1_HETGA|nr:uncharacterized protein LOC106007628 [Heterocephalus glaber]XP_021092525.1 uncharacterized protein LOC106007628 [Heterocephalus glaber]
MDLPADVFFHLRRGKERAVFLSLLLCPPCALCSPYLLQRAFKKSEPKRFTFYSPAKIHYLRTNIFKNQAERGWFRLPRLISASVGTEIILPSCLPPPPRSRAVPCSWAACCDLGPCTGDPEEAAPERNEDEGKRAMWTPLHQDARNSPTLGGGHKAGLARPPLCCPTLACLPSRGLPSLPRQGGHLHSPLPPGTHRAPAPSSARPLPAFVWCGTPARRPCEPPAPRGGGGTFQCLAAAPSRFVIRQKAADCCNRYFSLKKLRSNLGELFSMNTFTPERSLFSAST